MLCALGGIRTPNNGSEDRYDIHFTTSAISTYYLNNTLLQYLTIKYYEKHSFIATIIT